MPNAGAATQILKWVFFAMATTQFGLLKRVLERSCQTSGRSPLDETLSATCCSTRVCNVSAATVLANWDSALQALRNQRHNQ